MKVTEFITPAAAANLILGALALVLAAIGAAGWWVAAYRAKVQALLYSLRHHPRAVRAEQRYRTQIEFLVRRLRPEGAFGLSFTIGLAALAVSVWVFSSVLQDVLTHEEIALFDAPIVSYIAGHRLPWLTECMEVITYLGKATVLSTVVIACGLLMRLRTGFLATLIAY